MSLPKYRNPGHDILPGAEKRPAPAPVSVPALVLALALALALELSLPSGKVKRKP